MKCHRVKHAGFTLLELMVASAITAVIGIIAATMLPNMIENHAQVINEEKALIKVERALKIIRSDIAQLIIRPEVYPFAEKPSTLGIDNQQLLGDENTIEFSTLQSSPVGNNVTQDIQRVRYFVDNQQLIRESILVDFPAANQLWRKTVLLNNIENLRFQYLFNEWKNTLIQEKSYPKAILVTIQSKRWEILEIVAAIAGVNT